MVKDRSARVALLVGVLVALGSTAVLGQTEPAQAPQPTPAESAPAQAPAPTESQPPDESYAVSVNGTSTLVGQLDPGTIDVDGTVIRMRGNQLVTIEDSSDPRVSGRAVITVNFDAYPDASGLAGATQVRFGRMRLENDDGAWSGHFAGSRSNAVFAQTYWLEGEGAYEGLSYVVTAGGNGNVWRSLGLIFPGEIPPMGDSISLPIDAIERDLPSATAPGA